MPRIRCHYLDCVFIEEGFCAAPAVELDPDEGCFTYRVEGAATSSDEDEDWTDDDDLLEQDWDEVNFEEEDEDDDDDDNWLDDED